MRKNLQENDDAITTKGEANKQRNYTFCCETKLSTRGNKKTEKQKIHYENVLAILML